MTEPALQLNLEQACPLCGGELARLEDRKRYDCKHCHARYRDADHVTLVAPAPGTDALRRLGSGGRPGVRRKSLISEDAGARAFQVLGRELRA